MIDRVEKQRVMDVLRRAGLWEKADQHREATRQRLRAEGKTKQEAVAAAWEEMADKFLPLAEQATPAFQTILPDGAECFDDFVDPEYGETDPAHRMRDAYVWVLAEFHRIVSDHETGSVLDLRRASTPPPVGIALTIAQVWAAKPCQRRDGLFREARRCLGAVPVPEPEPEPPLYEDEGGFIDEV